MKKIGIMTWYKYDNYGSLLQAYALLQVLKDMDIEAELINYNPHIPYRYSEDYLKRAIKKLLLYLKNYSTSIEQQLKKNNRFDEFRNKYLKQSAPAWTDNELFQLNEKYDAFICGSDQIWAPTVFDKNYFLDFVQDNYKKISYAPSIGLPEISNKIVKEKMKKLIGDIPFLSVREEMGKKLIYNLCGRESQVVLDPTLLLNKQRWNELIPDNFDEPYMLGYFLGENDKYVKISRELAEKYGIRLIIIPTKPNDLKYNEIINEPQGPMEFVKLIKNAKCVFTDSFHGTAFSVNYNIPFVTFRRFKENNLSQNSRIYNILGLVNLEERIYSDQTAIYLKEHLLEIDYKNCNNIIEKERERSIKYLENSLHTAFKMQPKAETKITSQCTGCGICTLVCPKECIKVELNQRGFYEASVNQEQCIKCNQCKKVCGQNIERFKIPQVKEKKVYAGYLKNKEVLKQVTSGGFCTYISEKALEKDIPVIGVRYNYTDCCAEHVVVVKKNGLSELTGSKYLQSNSLRGFKELKKLDCGVIIGTPCQIASVHNYLLKNNKRERFLLIDLICHGVPSYILWDKYIENKNISELRFRDKRNGWRNMTISYKENRKEYSNTEKKDLFYHFFNSGNVYNSACYECSFRNQGCADLRAADYWGSRFKNINEGRNMIIPLTRKGEEIIEKLAKTGEYIIEEGDIDDCLKYQQMTNTRQPLFYDEIFKDFKSNIPLQRIDKKYNQPQRRIQKLYRFIKR